MVPNDTVSQPISQMMIGLQNTSAAVVTMRAACPVSRRVDDARASMKSGCSRDMALVRDRWQYDRADGHLGAGRLATLPCNDKREQVQLLYKLS